MTELKKTLTDRGTARAVIDLVRRAARSTPPAKPWTGAPTATPSPASPSKARRSRSTRCGDGSRSSWTRLSEAIAGPLGARLEKKTPRTHYLYLTEQDLRDPARAAKAVAVAVKALELCRGRRVGERGGRDDAPTSWGHCPEHGYELNAHGLCPACEGE